MALVGDVDHHSIFNPRGLNFFIGRDPYHMGELWHVTSAPYLHLVAINSTVAADIDHSALQELATRSWVHPIIDAAVKSRRL